MFCKHKFNFINTATFKVPAMTDSCCLAVLEGSQSLARWTGSTSAETVFFQLNIRKKRLFWQRHRERKHCQVRQTGPMNQISLPGDLTFSCYCSFQRLHFYLLSRFIVKHGAKPERGLNLTKVNLRSPMLVGHLSGQDRPKVASNLGTSEQSNAHST